MNLYTTELVAGNLNFIDRANHQEGKHQRPGGLDFYWLFEILRKFEFSSYDYQNNAINVSLLAIHW